MKVVTGLVCDRFKIFLSRRRIPYKIDQLYAEKQHYQWVNGVNKRSPRVASLTVEQESYHALGYSTRVVDGQRCNK